MAWMLALVGIAWAQDGEFALDAGSFQVATPEGTLDVSRLAQPRPQRTKVDERLCVVNWVRSGEEVSPTIADCDERLVEPTKAALERWTWTWTPAKESTTTDADASESVVMESWFRYGIGEREPVGLFVTPHWRHATIIPKNMERMNVVRLEVPQPSYPEALLQEEAPEAICDVSLDVTFRGYPDQVVVTGCDAVFADVVEATAKLWRFKDPKVGGEPSTVSLVIGVVFEVQPSSVPGEVEGNVTVELPETETRPMNLRRITGGAVAPLIAGDPLITLDHGPYAEVHVHDWVWPENTPNALERSCNVLVQTNSSRRVLSWVEACDEGLADPVQLAVSQWSLKPGTILPGERYGRFRVAFIFPVDGGSVYLRLPEKDIVAVDKDARQFVRTYQEAKTRTRVPPKIPEGLTNTEDCVLSVVVSPSGKPREMTAVECSETVLAAATKAVKKWRWDPARENGTALESEATVRLKFSGG